VLIIVVDCHDFDRMDELKFEIQHMMNEDELRGVPVLIFANKQDLPDGEGITLTFHWWINDCRYTIDACME